MISKPIGLYPELPTAPPVVENEGAHNFRLQQIRDIREFLQKESETRDRLRKRYKSVWNIFYSITTASGLASVGTSAAAVGTLATGIGAPISIPLGAIAVSTGVISISSSALSKVAMKKLQKHESIKYTAMSKLSSIDQIVSRALEDSNISNEEFHFILREMESYRGHKTSIKERTRASLIELTADRERKIRAEGEKKGRQEAITNLLHIASVGKTNPP